MQKDFPFYFVANGKGIFIISRSLFQNLTEEGSHIEPKLIKTRRKVSKRDKDKRRKKRRKRYTTLKQPHYDTIDNNQLCEKILYSVF